MPKPTHVDFHFDQPIEGVDPKGVINGAFEDQVASELENAGMGYEQDWEWVYGRHWAVTGLRVHGADIAMVAIAARALAKAEA